MKKLFYAITVFAIIISMFSFSSFAETSETPEGVTEVETETNLPENTEEYPEATPETDEKAPETDNATEEDTQNPQQDASKIPINDENEILDQLLGIVTNGEIWAKIGVTILGAVALILTLRTYFDKFIGVINTIKDFIAGKATKEETESVIKNAITDFEKTYKDEYAKLEEKNDEMAEKYDEMSAKYDKQTAVLALTVLQLVKSPNARTQIMSLISDTKEIGEDVAKVIEVIEEEITEADAAIPKVETPNLDSIVNEVKKEEKSENKPIMSLR